MFISFLFGRDKHNIIILSKHRVGLGKPQPEERKNMPVLQMPTWLISRSWGKPNFPQMFSYPIFSKCLKFLICLKYLHLQIDLSRKYYRQITSKVYSEVRLFLATYFEEQEFRVVNSNSFSK